MHQPSSTRLNAGITLVELITVMLLLGILAVGVTSYLRLGATMYTEATSVQQVLQQSRFALERVTREVRGAVPGSVRVNGNSNNSINCVEFAPVAQSGIYRDLPLVPINRNWIGVTTIDTAWSVNNSQRLVIYATEARHIYDLSQYRSADIATDQSAMDDADGNAHTRRIRLLNNRPGQTNFGWESPQKRFYIANQPVSFCRQGNELRRYSNYGFSTAQPLPPNVPGELMAVGINNANEAMFRYSTANVSLTRSAILHLFWRLSPVVDVGQDLAFNHEIHVPNVP
jgi:MSHA biogenesis protein MshO